MEILNNLLIVAAGIVCVFALYKDFAASDKRTVGGKRSVKRITNTPSENKRIEYIILGTALVIALFVRIYKFGSVPGGFNQDGAMAAVDAKALADYGTDRYGMHMPVHLTAWGYGQMSALLSYMMVPFIKLFRA